MMRSCTALLFAFWAGAVGAVELSLPQGARLVSDRGSAFDSYELPVAPFADGAVETRTLEGRIARQSWHVDSATITTLQVMAPLRTQLADAGFQTIFECDAKACGGFDFRFGIEVIPAPDMYVDIRDYRFLAAERGDEAITLIISRSRTAAYAQIIQVGPVEGATLDIETTGETPRETEEAPSSFADQLLDHGHAVLSDLNFRTGTTELGDATYASLESLAAFMRENATAEIALVGHTDATGDLETNIAVSKRRAESVRNRLIQSYDLSADRVRAEGMGYLAPRASNLTEAGRAENRRVEVILLSME